jgi:dienelactone hydrolase
MQTAERPFADGMEPAEPITGEVAGVPFVALPPGSGPRSSAPVVLAWHLLDPPRTEAAFAAALPLRGLHAWRIYLGLPMSGSRLPAGGWEEMLRLGSEDAVLKVYQPIIYGAAAELGPALSGLRDRLGLEGGPIGVMGASAGAAVALLVLAESELDVAAAVLVSPMVQLRRVVEAMSRQFGVAYPWSGESRAVAQRLDFVARAAEIAERAQPALLCVVGEEDDGGFHESAAELVSALSRHHGDSRRAELVAVAGMAHALADEPGIDPAPQTPHAATVDRHAVRWFQRHLDVGRQ